MASGLPVERLRQYLRELNPQARAMLAKEFERRLLRGEEMSVAELVLTALRRDDPQAQRVAPRGGNLSRLFFQPLELFLVDAPADHAHPGRIARVALEPLWQWITRDLIPGEAKAVAEDVARAIANADGDRAEMLARGFQDVVVLRIREALQNVQDDEKAARRLSAQITSPRALHDARALLAILERRDALQALTKRLPDRIEALDGDYLTDVKTFTDSTLSDPPLFLCALLLLMNRLAAPWQVIRLASAAAASHAAEAIEKTPYGVVIEIMLAEIGRMVCDLKTELRSGDAAVTTLLKGVHDALRGLRAEIVFPQGAQAGAHLAQFRNEVSAVLTDEIGAMPGRVRRLLRLRPAKDIPPGSSLNPGDVDDVEALIEFAIACSYYAEEFAVGEVTQRAYSDLEKYLETSPAALIQSLQQAGEAERNFRRSQLDAAIRFYAKVFGPDQAAKLQKQSEAAGTPKAVNG